MSWSPPPAERGPIDVTLVEVPFGPLTSPPLGVSTLLAGLRAAGVESRARHLSLDLAAEVGPHLVDQLGNLAAHSHLPGEWVFTLALWGERAPDPTPWMDRYASSTAPVPLQTLIDLRGWLGGWVARMADLIVAQGPSIVGLSTTFQQTSAAGAVAAAVKARSPDTVVVLGGANCAGPMGAAMAEAFPWVDHVFTGEADLTFPRWVTGFLDGERGPRVVQGAPVHDLGSVATPDFTDWFADLQRLGLRDAVVPSLPFEASRGCWWGQRHHCTFCGLNALGMDYRSKPAATVIGEVRDAHARYGVSRFAAVDNIIDHRLIGSLDTLEELDLSLFFEVKSTMRPDQLTALAAAGVREVQPGIESLDDDVLALMDKGATKLQNLRFLRTCAELGVRPAWNILLGFPDEGDDPYHRLIDEVPSLTHLPSPSGPIRIQLSRFSPYHDRADELGFAGVRAHPVHAELHPLPDELLENMAYYFAGTARGAVTADVEAAVRAALDRWRSSRAVLLAASTDEGLLIIDTREGAEEGARLLTADEEAVLAWFRAPRRPERASAVVDGGKAIVRELLARRYVIGDGAKAISVVVEVGRTVHDSDGETPHGHLAGPAPEEPWALGRAVAPPP